MEGSLIGLSFIFRSRDLLGIFFNYPVNDMDFCNFFYYARKRYWTRTITIFSRYYSTFSDYGKSCYRGLMYLGFSFPIFLLSISCIDFDRLPLSPNSLLYRLFFIFEFDLIFPGFSTPFNFLFLIELTRSLTNLSTFSIFSH